MTYYPNETSEPAPYAVRVTVDYGHTHAPDPEKPYRVQFTHDQAGRLISRYPEGSRMRGPTDWLVLTPEPYDTPERIAVLAAIRATIRAYTSGNEAPFHIADEPDEPYNPDAMPLPWYADDIQQTPTEES